MIQYSRTSAAEQVQ